MGFETLLLIGVAGLAGPLLALSERHFVPVVIGEIVAGVVIGRTGARAIDPTNVTTAFLATVGFAMLMLTAGMHLPLRDSRLRSSVRGGLALAATVAVLAIPAGFAAAAIAGTGHAAIYAVVLASGSVAILLPAIEEAGTASASALTVMTQVTIADVVTIIAVPIVLAPARTSRTILGGALVAGTALLLLGAARALRDTERVRRVRALSKRRQWALDLRLSLVVLFLLAWIAQKSGTSVLIAGFGAGLMVAVIGGPKRLSTQMRGIAGGFFIPLYFVVLGAQLDLRGLVKSPSIIALAVALLALNVAIHVAAALLARRPPSTGLAASAQLGVPAAVASLGLASHVLSGPVATAIVAAAVVSLGVCTLGVESLLAHTDGAAPDRGAAAR
jgi:Kef-type K+ transport system membrane component KefB